MSKNITPNKLSISSQNFVNDNLFVVDFVVDKDTFASLRDRITEQYLTNIEIAGFRKGHAPRDKAMQKADLPYLENLIWNEAITRNYTEADKLIRDELTIKERNLINITLSQNPETIGDVDGGFKFQLNAYLLPKIDLKMLDNMDFKTPVEADIKGRTSLKDYTVRERTNFLNTFNEYVESDKAVTETSRLVVDISEKNLLSDEVKDTKDALIGLGLNQFPEQFEKNLIGTKAGDQKNFDITIFNRTISKDNPFHFDITIKAVQTPKYKTLEELFAGSEFVQTNFETEGKFVADLEQRYAQETTSLIKDLQLKSIINHLVTNSGDIQIEEEQANAEVERLFTEFNKNQDPVKTFNDSQFPFAGVATDKTLKTEIAKYVRGEFSLSKILMVVYYQKITNKTSEEELEQNVNEVIKDPTKYGYDKAVTRDKLKDQVFDIILRNKSLDYLLGIAKFD
jgi:FKBP-type peptidyl-prolyl cis-trans isomerase (trigger factor)